MHVRTPADLHQAFARLRPAEGTIARFLVYTAMTKRPFQTSSHAPFGVTENRFRFASRLLTLRLAMTVNSLARVSRRNA